MQEGSKTCGRNIIFSFPFLLMNIDGTRNMTFFWSSYFLAKSSYHPGCQDAVEIWTLQRSYWYIFKFDFSWLCEGNEDSHSAPLSNKEYAEPWNCNFSLKGNIQIIWMVILLMFSRMTHLTTPLKRTLLLSTFTLASQLFWVICMFFFIILW